MWVASSLVNIYMLLIFIRILLSWVSWMGSGRFLETLDRITDPYLNWFRRFTFLRVGFMDLSPIFGLGVLSIVSRLLSSIAYNGRISLGIVLVMLLQVLWGVVSFFLGFLIIVLILRLIAHFTKRNMNGPFWKIVAAVSQPVLKKINSLFFKSRIVYFRNGVIVSIAVLVLLYTALRFLVFFLSAALARLPV